MAMSGSGTLPVFMSKAWTTEYSGQDPAFRWRYSWSYAPAADKISVSLCVQCRYSQSNAWNNYDIRPRNAAGQPWVEIYAGDSFVKKELIGSITAPKAMNATAAGEWTDIAETAVTVEIKGKGGKAKLYICCWAALYGNNSYQITCDTRSEAAANSFEVKADRGLLRVPYNGQMRAALVFVPYNGVYRQVIPYTAKDGTYHICV